MLTQTTAADAPPDETAAVITIVGSLGARLAASIEMREGKTLGAARVVASGTAAAPEEGGGVVVVADLPERADPAVFGGDPAGYGDGLRAFLATVAADPARLVIWLSVPYQAYRGAGGVWTEPAVRALNQEMKAFCVRRGIHQIALAAKLERWGAADHLTGDARPTLNRKGVSAMASAIVKVVQQWRVRSSLGAAACPRLDPARFPDFEARFRAAPDEADRVLLERLTVRDTPLPSIRSGAGLTLDNRLTMGVWDEVPLDDPIRWNMKGPDRTWESCFLALDFVPSLLREHAGTDDAAYRRKAVDVTLSWRDANPPSAPSTPRAWHEGTTTKRLQTLVVLARALVAARVPTRPGGLAQVLAMIEQHVTFILNPDLYIRAGNHGLRQDAFILLAATTFPDFVSGDEWHRAACRRLERSQIEDAISGDGVWLEHSPGYHSEVTRRLCTVLAILECGPPVPLRERLRDVVDRMVLHSAHVVRPDGHVPAIGDTLPFRPLTQGDLTKYAGLPSGPHAVYSETEGRAGTPPAERDAFYPEAGWAILRDAWRGPEDFGETAYVNFHANFHSGKHKHADDLSFVFYARGRDWIVDSGRLNNELDDPLKDHFRLDTSAHNAYSVDGRGYGFNAKRADRVGIVRTHSTDEGAFALGVNRLYEHAWVTRLLVFLRHEPMIVLVDELVSRRGEREWASHLHLDHDLELSERGDVIAARCPSSGWTLDVTAAGGTGAATEIVRGRRDPFLGWLTVAWNQAVEAPVVVRRVRGRRLTVVTALRLRRPDAPALGAVRLAERSGRGCRVDLEIGGRTRRLAVRTGRRPGLELS